MGIRNPFNADEIVKVLTPKGHGVATSGNYIRGDHIYNPHTGRYGSDDIVSLTVIGPMCWRPIAMPPPHSPWGGTGIHFIEAHAGAGRL